MKSVIFLLAGSLAMSAQAAMPAELLGGYAAAAGAGFKADAARGAAFYAKAFGVSAKMPSCASCHTDSPSQPGRHVVTDKAIKPLAPAANPERFSDPAKVEKWFKRNCSEVVGRECTAAEKADFIAFVTGGR
ncbi:MAG: DUF1924 domain-containing protein [Rhodocyclaceae bacterium]|jgi:cytochrome c553|nr:DUF1924 domain-containing protein [Rhodocyclaceae bacterium]